MSAIVCDCLESFVSKRKCVPVLALSAVIFCYLGKGRWCSNLLEQLLALFAFCKETNLFCFSYSVPQNTVTTWVTCNTEDNTDSPPCSSAVCTQVSILLILSTSQVEVMQFRYVSLTVPGIVSSRLTFINVVNVSILKPLYAFS